MIRYDVLRFIFHFIGLFFFFICCFFYVFILFFFFFFFSSRRRHTRYWRDWSSDVCSSDLGRAEPSSRDRRALSGPQVEPELPGAPDPARGDREPDHGGAAEVQRGGARLQHAPAPLPRLHRRVAGGLPAEGVLRGHARRGDRAQGEVLACSRRSSPSPSSCPRHPAPA